MTLHQTDSSGSKCQLCLMSYSLLIKKKNHHVHYWVIVFHKLCTVSPHTQCWTLSDVLTAWTRGGVGFSSSQGRVKGRTGGTACIQLSLCFQKLHAFYKNQSPPAESNSSHTVCNKILLCKWCQSPWSLRVWQLNALVASVMMQQCFWCHLLSLDKNLQMPNCCYH